MKPREAEESHAIRLPDFIAVGPGRTATTWLHEKLKGHADLPAGIKETDFFTTNYAKGIDWYARHFRYASGALPVGEVNPYFGFPEAAERIQRHIPRCKIICTFRNPVERIYSSYKLWRHYTQTSLPMDEFLVKVPQVIEVTRYAKHLPDWQSRFGAERVLVLLNDDLRADPQAFFDRACDFIGIARYPVPTAGPEMINSIDDLPRYPHLARRARHLMDWLEERQAYVVINGLESAGVWRWCFGGGTKFGPIDPKLEAHLIELLLPDIEALEKMLGRDLTAWKGRSAERHVSPRSADGCHESR